MLKIWKANEDGRRMLTDGESSNGLCQVDRKPDCLILLMLCCICNTLCVIYGFCETKYNKACPCLTIRVSQRSLLDKEIVYRHRKRAHCSRYNSLSFSSCKDLYCFPVAFKSRCFDCSVI
jgi:hypothetical protein